MTSIINLVFLLPGIKQTKKRAAAAREKEATGGKASAKGYSE